jgi:hypothetical protein
MACWIISMKYFNYTIWNGTSNQLVAQPERTVSLCAAQFVVMLIEIYTVLCVELKCLCNRLPQASGSEPLQNTVGFSCCVGNKETNYQEMYTCCMYRKYVRYRSVCPVVLWTNAIGWKFEFNNP